MRTSKLAVPLTILTAILLFLTLCLGSLYAQEQSKRIFMTLKPSDASCVEEIKFFSQSRQRPLNASRIDERYFLGPLLIGEVVEISIVPSKECYAEGVLEEARLKVYQASIDTSTGIGTVIINPTYNGSYTILLHKYSKIYLIVLANPPECLSGVESDKPVKQLGDGYYRVGPWLVGGMRRDAGSLVIKAAEGCRFQKWEGAYEFTSQYQESTIVRGITPEKNMTLTALFENVAGSATTQTLGEPIPIVPAMIAFFQTPLGGSVVASPLIAVACYASVKVLKWVKKRKEEKKRQREDTLKLLCMMERSAASMGVEAHPWTGVFNLMAKYFTLEDMMAGLANMPKIREDVDAAYLTDEPRCIQHLIQLKEKIKGKYEEKGRMEDVDRLRRAFEPAIAGYLALVGAMPVGKTCEQLLDEATPLAQTFETLDMLSRAAAINGVMEGFASIARRWIQSRPLLEVGQKLKRMLINSGVWELCNKPPKRVIKILEALTDQSTLRECGLVVVEVLTRPTKVEEVVETVVERPLRLKLEEKEAKKEFRCPSCGKYIPEEVWEKVAYCPVCGARLKEAVKEEKAKKEKMIGEVTITEETRFAVKYVHEDEIGKLCPLCGRELKKGMGGRICYTCGVVYKVEKGPTAEAGEEEAWVLKVPKEAVEEPGIKVITLKNYSYGLPASFKVKCEEFEASVYGEPTRRGVRVEEYIEELVKAIERDAQVGWCSVILMARAGADPWARREIFLERTVGLVAELARSLHLAKKLRLIIVIPEETIFFEKVAEELKRRLEETKVEFREYPVEVPYEEVLERARVAGVERPEKLIHLLRAFPGILRHLRRGKALPEAVEIELRPGGEELRYVVDVVKKFHEFGRELTEEEVRDLVGVGGMAWARLQTLRALGLVR